MVQEDHGHTTYTFRRLGADAELDLTLTRRGAMPRLGAWVMLLLAGGLLGWLWFKRSQG